MFEITGKIKLYSYEEAIENKLPNGFYFLYHIENEGDLTYKNEIVRYQHNPYSGPRISYAGEDFDAAWEQTGEYFEDTRVDDVSIMKKTIYKQYLMGPIVPPNIKN